jgi:muramidase (phage lysozyme)
VTRDDLLHALQSNNVQAFLRLIRQGETSQTEDAYQTMFGGSRFTSFADHPRQKNKAAGLVSTAAGAFQFLVKTWDSLVKQYQFPDFSPLSQDMGAVALIAGRKALDDVLAGRVVEAIQKCKDEWASLPGSTYGQPTQKLEKALAVYEAFGGARSPSLEPVPPTPAEEVKPMAPLVLPILSALSSILPQLGAWFGSGSEVAQRNVAAGSLIAQKLVEVTQSVNLQEAAEKIQSDPAILATATTAVNDVVLSLQEVGGGINRAREAAADVSQLPFYKNPAFIIACMLAPLIYMVAVEILFNPSGQTWSDDIKMMFVTAIVSGLLGSMTGFFLGSSLGSQKKDAALGAR